MIQQTFISHQSNRQYKKDLIKIGAHFFCLLPLSLFIGRELARFHTQPDLMRAMLIFTGRTSVALLILSLALTPARLLFNLKALSPLRKPIGLYAFLFAAAHLFIHAGIALQFDFGLIWQDFVSRRAAQIGYASFFILLLLALTSVPITMRIAGRWWKSLHRTVYFAAILALWHWFVVTNLRVLAPAFVLLGLAVLLFLRTEKSKKMIVRVRKGRKQNTMRQPRTSAEKSERAQLTPY